MELLICVCLIGRMILIGQGIGYTQGIGVTYEVDFDTFKG
jgi:hypothetical protein